MLAWLPIVVVVSVALAALGSALLVRRPRSCKPVAYANPREAKLTQQLAREVGCSLIQARSAIRREIDIAPSQADETLIKRAAYHYRQELPEATRRAYRDPTTG